MNIMSKIDIKLRRRRCERLVKQTGNEMTISGASFGVEPFKIDIGSARALNRAWA